MSPSLYVQYIQLYNICYETRNSNILLVCNNQDFTSDFVVRQTTGFSPDAPMTVEIKDSTMTSGAAGVVFDNDGGRLILENIEISDLTSASIVATANAGTSFLQDSKISSSSVSSITFTTAAASQTVMNVEVSGMSMVEDAFFVEGSESVLSIVDSNIVKNEIESPMSWTAVTVSSQATATITGSTISENTGLEFGVSSTLGGLAFLQNSNLVSNFGAISNNVTSALLFGISDSTLFVEDTKFTDNREFSVS